MLFLDNEDVINPASSFVSARIYTTTVTTGDMQGKSDWITNACGMFSICDIIVFNDLYKHFRGAL